ncbi:unnamed protein product [Rodentolepis nana]|uniref:Secreted protein n=1 Tax=Rodentolepis nana TaxID=102285 RepID=A0A0R3TQT4_RODNA|nr:unnamed protein product [Rodentolepis nana]
MWLVGLVVSCVKNVIGALLLSFFDADDMQPTQWESLSVRRGDFRFHGRICAYSPPLKGLLGGAYGRNTFQYATLLRPCKLIVYYQSMDKNRLYLSMGKLGYVCYAFPIARHLG